MTILLILACTVVLLAGIYAAWDADRHRTEAQRYNDAQLAELSQRLSDLERQLERQHAEQQQIMSKLNVVGASQNRLSRMTGRS